MTQRIVVGVERKAEELSREFHAYINRSEAANRVSVKTETAGGYCFFHLQGTGEGENLLAAVAQILASWMVDHWEKGFVESYLAEEYGFFSPSERVAIGEKACQIIDQREAGTKDFVVYRISRRDRLADGLREYLEGEKRLQVEGFVTFRLKEYQRQILDAVDGAVDEFIMEREYNKFVRLLKHLVDGQEPRIMEAHLFPVTGKRLELTDERGRPVSQESIRGEGWVDDDLHDEDMVISALISLAPRRVYFHLRDPIPYGETVQTVKHVFGERVYFCPGCKRCLTPKQADQGGMGGNKA